MLEAEGKMRFSIIVPVYNVEDYLEKCLDSIINQAFHDYELILVDDGSEDRSGAICDIYAPKYDRVTVIHQENLGPGGARNSALKISRGEYIIFVDSDDHIEPDSLGNFHLTLNRSGNPDLMLTRTKKIFAGRIVFVDENLLFEQVKDGSKADVINMMFNYSENLWPSMNYVVKKDLIDDNNIDFPSSCLHEDVDWTFKIFLFADTFTANEFYWYNHRKDRPFSITNTKTPKRTLDVIKLVSEIVEQDKRHIKE